MAWVLLAILLATVDVGLCLALLNQGLSAQERGNCPWQVPAHLSAPPVRPEGCAKSTFAQDASKLYLQHNQCRTGVLLIATLSHCGYQTPHAGLPQPL